MRRSGRRPVHTEKGALFEFRIGFHPEDNGHHTASIALVQDNSSVVPSDRRGHPPSPTVRYPWTSPIDACVLPLLCALVTRTAREDQVAGLSCSCGQCCVPGPSDDLRVLIVDDHPMVRAALRETLSDEDGVTVVGE